ncbi:MAG: dCTP deaminase [Candidatus Thiodiazotropha sp.]
MQLLNRDSLLESLHSDDNESLFLEPLLDESQVGNVTIDLRLGYDFLVSVLTRKPLISVADNSSQKRGIRSYFQETRREIGERFVLYPSQLVVTTTLEYLALPSNYYVDVLSRSSYTRLGIHVNTMVQPGFRGCIPLELFNHGNNAVELVVGSRISQARFFELDSEGKYIKESPKRKYYGDVRPTVSKADMDPELFRLS